MYEFDLEKERKVIDRLMGSGPLVRYHSLVELLGRSQHDPEVRSARQASRKSRDVMAILSEERRDGTFGNVPSRPDWWGPNIRAKDAPNVHPWALKMLQDAGYSRGDEEMRLAAEYLMDLQEADGGFGKLGGVERVRFSADLTYILSLLGYDHTIAVKNSLRWLLARLKEFAPGRFDRSENSPGRIVLEALTFYEPFLFSPLARKILHTLFESKQSVLTGAMTPEGPRLGGYDGLLTWSELGFRLGWPRSSEVPHQVTALLMESRNRDGSWGEKGADLVSTLRALVLWRHLFEAYGPVPEGFQLKMEMAPRPRPTPTAAEAETASAQTASTNATGAAPAVAGATGPGQGTRDRHVRAFSRAGLDAVAGELVVILTALGYEGDWRPMYEVHFRAAGLASTFKLRLEAKQPGCSGPQLVLLGSGVRQLSLKHWGRQLTLDRQRMRYVGEQLRLMLDNGNRKSMVRLKEFLDQVGTPRQVGVEAKPAPTTSRPHDRSHRSARRRSRGAER